MKRVFCFILAICLLLLICGCREEEPEYVHPVQFYYVNPIILSDSIGYGDTYSVFISETREAAGFLGDIEAFLLEYLKGPITTDLFLMIPSDVQLLDVKQNSKVIRITFSEELAKLMGIDLTLACSCLSMTVFENFKFDTIEIAADGILLEGKESVIIHRDKLLLIDSLPEMNEAENTEEQ